MPILQRIANLFRRNKLLREMEAELASHLEMRIEDNLAHGMDENQARRSALLSFGNPQVVKEKAAQADAATWLASLCDDARYAARKLTKSPAFSLTVIATLALGIGANTAIFSIVDAVLLRPLPYKNADRLVVIWQTDAAHRGTGAWFNPYREFDEWQRNSRSFDKLAAMTWAVKGGKTVEQNGKPIEFLALPASVNFFSMLGVPPQLGRTFDASDLQKPCTLVLAYSFWQQKLAAKPDIAGKTLMVDRSPCVVAGVMPQDFAFYPKQTDAWSLITPTSQFLTQPWDSMTGVFGLLKPGVTRAQAEAELSAMEAHIQPEAPATLSLLRSAMPIVLDLQDNFTWLAGRNLRTGLWVLTGAVSLILLMTCLNVANLLLGRTLEHSREMAIRSALGSGRARLIRQMLTESFLLSGLGTCAGILLAQLMLRWFRAVNPVELPPGSPLSLNWQVLLFAALLGIGSAIVFGLFPALRASQVDLNSILKSGGRSASSSARDASHLLVVMQIALSLMLFIGAGLLAASLWRMASTRLGYRTDHVFTAAIDLPGDRYTTPDARSRFASNLTGRVAALPGVEAVTAASNVTPLGESPLSIQGDASNVSAAGVASQSIGSNFFAAMHIPLLRGRAFDTRDQQNTQQVAIVNEALALRYFPHSDPIGHSLKLSRAEDPSEPWLTIVGVAADIKTTTVFQEMGYVEQPAVYRPLTQAPPTSLALIAVTKASPQQLTEHIEAQLNTIDGSLVLSDPETMQEMQSAVLAQPRFRAVLFSSFAALSLVLAVVGLYGVLAQIVAQRSREIAIRMALGASRTAVIGSVFRRALAMAATGISLGLLGAALAVRALAGLLYEIHPENAATFASAAGLLLITALAASWFPAWRAAAIDPMQALRNE